MSRRHKNSPTSPPNHAAVAFAAATPEFKKLHARAKRVVKARKKLIASITDPSLRASVS
jgi:hypothetical protein